MWLALGGTLLGAALAAVGYTLAAHRATAAERRAPLPGDALIPRPMYATTQATTIGAPPERVWPWLAQMGAGRGGWYSYDRIDNDGEPSATEVLARFQRIAAGDLLPALRGATDGFLVLAVEPGRDLVLGGPPGPGGGQRATWEFRLAPLPGRRTRLLVRARVARDWLAGQETRPAPRRSIERVYALLARLPGPALVAVGGFGHRVMQNAQLRGVRRRAERR